VTSQADSQSTDQPGESSLHCSRTFAPNTIGQPACTVLTVDTAQRFRSGDGLRASRGDSPEFADTQAFSAVRQERAYIPYEQRKSAAMRETRAMRTAILRGIGIVMLAGFLMTSRCRPARERRNRPDRLRRPRRYPGQQGRLLQHRPASSPGDEIFPRRSGA
jgi:hypothetical protein